MNQTVRVASPISDDNPTGFVVINLSDFDPQVHELFDPADEVLLANLAVSGSVVASNSAGPSFAQIESARSELNARHDQLEARRADLDAEAARQAEQREILEAERLRLTALAQSLPPSGDDKIDLTATQIKEALTARGIDFKGNASKAELQGLLDAAV